ncbi:MAG: ABC transporter ATP-binding protein [Proteobacteria bacterium]|nr:ABC transporter ATP-binding protein [Pseudomonadota bacterium]
MFFGGRKNPVWVGYVFITVALIILPFLVEASMGRTWVRILDFALIYAMLALGLNIVVGFAGLLDLGYIAFYAVGAYTWALLASPQFGLHLPFWAIIPIGFVVAGIFGVLLGAPTLRLRGDYLAIVTLGFGEIVRIFLNNLDHPINITNGPVGINLIDPIQIAGVSLTKSHEILGLEFSGAHSYYYVLLFLLLATVFVCIRLENSRLGRAWVAIREDETAAQAMGINTRNVKLLAFAMGASFGGIAGGMFASFQGFVSPESFILLESIMVLCMVVLGGMGNIWGVILGTFLLAILPEVLRDVSGPIQENVLGRVWLDPESLRMVLFGLALILVMLLRPSGLWPKR